MPAGQPRRLTRRPPTDASERARETRATSSSRQLGYQYVTAATSCASSGPKLLGLFANEEMFEHRREGQGDIYDPVVPLKDMAGKALDVVSQGP